jgi:homoserine/homoserine lactone efflux protein
VLAANALYFAISATGLFAVVVACDEIFVLIKWLGAAYLIGLGVKAWRTSGSGASSDLPDASASHGRPAATRGFAVQAANPKTLLFFGALLPSSSMRQAPSVCSSPSSA